LKKNKKSLYNQILEIREEVEQAEKVKNCIEQLQEQEKEFTKSKSQFRTVRKGKKWYNIS